MWLDDHRTALYRFYAEGGVLLYVGITADVDVRFSEHERLKDWWPLVADRTIEWFDNRPLALAAELKAIREEKPVHNVTGTPWSSTRRELTEEERTVGQLRANLTAQCQQVRYTNEPAFVVDSSRKRNRVAVIVPFEFYERALEALGETAVPAAAKS